MACARPGAPPLSEPGVWRERAGYRDLRSVIDPADANGNKNRYIDLLQKSALGRSFEIGRGDVALDFGCGIGRFTDWLEKRAATVIGIDSDSEMIAVARELHPHSRCTWMTYSGDGLPLEDESVDRILSVWVLQHVLDDATLRRLVADFVRVLRPGGSVALIEQVIPGQSSLVPGYIHQRTAKQYQALFGAAGFHLVTSRPIRAAWRIASAVVRRRVPQLALRVLAEATLLRAESLSVKASYADQLMIFSRGEPTN
jgi:SAM-dependent methyltransferase